MICSFEAKDGENGRGFSRRRFWRSGGGGSPGGGSGEGGGLTPSVYMTATVGMATCLDLSVGMIFGVSACSDLSI
jgi:hypothetical protein